jgi:hypothetical protein
MVFPAASGCSQLIDASGATFAEPKRDAGVEQSRAGDHSVPICPGELNIDHQSGSNAHFGQAVTFAGDELIVSAPTEDLTMAPSGSLHDCASKRTLKGAGRVYGYRWNSGMLEQAFALEHGRANDGDGAVLVSAQTVLPVYSLASSADLIAVGVPSFDYNSCTDESAGEGAISAGDVGVVYLYERDDSGAWFRSVTLFPSDPQAHQFFGASIALRDNLLLVGATGHAVRQSGKTVSSAGMVYIFERSGDGWNEKQRLVASNPLMNAYFGGALAIDGDTLAVGAFEDSHGERGVNPAPVSEQTMNSGAAYVFREMPETGTWIEQAFIKAPNADSNDQFGSVALEGDTLAIGALIEAAADPVADLGSLELGAIDDNAFLGAGAVYVYHRDSEHWRLQDYIKAPAPEVGAAFGAAIRIREGALLISAPTQDGKDARGEAVVDSGAAYIYAPGDAKDSRYVLRQSLLPTHPKPNDVYGASLAFTQDWAVLGGIDSNQQRGSVRLFNLQTPCTP